MNRLSNFKFPSSTSTGTSPGATASSRRNNPSTTTPRSRIQFRTSQVNPPGRPELKMSAHTSALWATSTAARNPLPLSHRKERGNKKRKKKKKKKKKESATATGSRSPYLRDPRTSPPNEASDRPIRSERLKTYGHNYPSADAQHISYRMRKRSHTEQSYQRASGQSNYPETTSAENTIRGDRAGTQLPTACRLAGPCTISRGAMPPTLPAPTRQLPRFRKSS
jgi:hypothetical protein